MQTGNSWMYRVTQGRINRPGAVNVGEAVEVEGRQYYKLQFFDRDLLVRQIEDGSLLSWDADTKKESVWLPLGAAEKQTVQTTFDTCSTSATVESRNATIKTEIGEFNNALQIRYRTNCADAGTTVQYFVPYVGLVQYESTSIAGPVTHDVVYLRTGNTAVDVKNNAFTLATDAPVYKAGQTAEATARVTLRASEQITLTFPSGQSTDMRLRDEGGKSVYFWSADKLFPMIYRGAVPVGPGEKTWVMSFPVGQLAPGKYTVEGWLTTQPKLYSASITIEVK
ncbi:MAG: BsuPI-related putative proteinase inhibitor [Bryobacteraceae bacterium]|nr:BsuPI-related putative proteinase inhibitor [Bryobacteraceae bacterium]